MTFLRYLCIAGYLAGTACIGGPTDPGPLPDGRRALFIGNSYIYSQNIPLILEAFADSAHGDLIATAQVAAPDFALIDHWNTGPSHSAIALGGWEWVILQQGPSSVSLNRDTLRLATALFAPEIKAVGAIPALFSAWPSESRRQDFPAAIESYRLAAEDVSGIFLPIASAWLEAWDRDASLPLYEDGLHPSPYGAYLTALVLYGVLLDRSPIGLPPKLKTRAGATVNLPPGVAAVLQEAAAAAIAGARAP